VPGYRCLKGRLLRHDVNPVGYHRVRLSRDGIKTAQLVHRLVAFAFVGPQPSSRHQIAHNDGNPRNNRASNLRWATVKENAADRAGHGRVPTGETHCSKTRPEVVLRGERHGMAKLTDEAVRSIRRDARSGSVIAAEHGVGKGVVNSIRRGEGWRHVT
jgi:hypothetical protein